MSVPHFQTTKRKYGRCAHHPNGDNYLNLGVAPDFFSESGASAGARCPQLSMKEDFDSANSPFDNRFEVLLFSSLGIGNRDTSGGGAACLDELEPVVSRRRIGA